MTNDQAFLPGTELPAALLSSVGQVPELPSIAILTHAFLVATRVMPRVNWSRLAPKTPLSY
jgi:hypothetical protein